jgi:hypothetical protein
MIPILAATSAIPAFPTLTTSATDHQMASSSTIPLAQTQNDAESRIVDLFHSLQQDGLAIDNWAETLSATPSVIVIMGESMVVASVPNAAQVRIKDSDLS